MLSAQDISSIIDVDLQTITNTWQPLIGELQNQGMNTPNTRVALAATIAVESMFNPAANANPNDPFGGKGLIQLTGLPNYEKYGTIIGVNLSGNPIAATNAQNSIQIAGAYFKDHCINTHADRGNWLKVRMLVNGGTNGFGKFLSYVWLMLDNEYK
jgi:predicted chitinase